jgi:osmoprotectant transport system ATP-binding protein
MDEPFGAIDPITRERLQNEFLRIQSEIKKTIVFVTHDIEEAIKMGDRIAILRNQSRIAQYDTPERILVDPADDFVAGFIGRGATLKRLNLSRVDSVDLLDWPTVVDGEMDSADVRRSLEQSGRPAVLVLNRERRPVSWLAKENLCRLEGASPSETGEPVTARVRSDATLSDALDAMLGKPYSVAVVIDRDGAFLGVVDFATVNAAISNMQATRDAELPGENQQ